MASRKPAETPDAPPANSTPPPADANGAVPAVFDWGTLSAPVAMPSKQVVGNITVKVLETVPEPIRVRAEQSLTLNTAAVAAKPAADGKRPRVNYHWDVQPVPDVKTGEAFVKALLKYSKYRPADVDIPHIGEGSPKGQITTRAGEPTWFVTGADGIPVAATQTADGAYLGVRYSTRPLEQRGTYRLPGTAE